MYRITKAMKTITIEEALRMTSPQPVSLVCAQTPEGKTNMAAVAWWTYLENEPPMIGFSMWKKNYTCDLIVNTGKLVLCLPGEAIADAAFQCGVVSGRDVDKAREYGIELVDAPVGFPVHSKVAFVCTVENKIELGGESLFFVCKVDEMFCNENERHVYVRYGSNKLAAIS